MIKMTYFKEHRFKKQQEEGGEGKGRDEIEQIMLCGMNISQ